MSAAKKKIFLYIFEQEWSVAPGGWGYVILLCGFLVQVVAMGLQQSVAILIFPLSNRKYQVVDDGYIGKNI